MVGRQRRATLDILNQEIEGALCMRLDEFELREGAAEGLDMIAVLHLIETIGRMPITIVVVNPPSTTQNCPPSFTPRVFDVAVAAFGFPYAAYQKEDKARRSTILASRNRRSLTASACWRMGRLTRD